MGWQTRPIGGPHLEIREVGLELKSLRRGKGLQGWKNMAKPPYCHLWAQYLHRSPFQAAHEFQTGRHLLGGHVAFGPPEFSISMCSVDSCLQVAKTETSKSKRSRSRSFGRS